VMWLALMGIASALPTRSVDALAVGAQVLDVVVSNDGSTVAVLGSGGSVFVVDMATWDLKTANPCAGVGGITAAPGTDKRFWAGCAGGEIAWFEFGSSGVKVADSASYLAEEDIIAMASNDTLVFALAENPFGDGNPQLHAYNPEIAEVIGGGFPSILSYKNVEDMEANLSYVYLSHGGASFSKVAAGAGGATRQQGAPSASQTSDIELIGGSRVFVAGGRSGVVEFQNGSNILSLFLGEDQGVDGASAIAASLDEAWFVVADDERDEILFFGLDTSAGVPKSEQIGGFPFSKGAGSVVEFGVVAGYLFAGTDSGDLHIMTDRPWVVSSPATPAAALNGERVSVSFTSDTAGDWTARRGAKSNGGGAVVASGSVSAGEAVTASFEIDDRFKEGDNILRIVVEDSDGAKGHDSTSVNVDNPPTKVRLRNADVGFGDTRLIVSLNGINDEDLSHYVLYLSAEPFEANDFPTEGPGFVGVDGDVSGAALNLPLRVSASPGKDKTITIEPLTNGVSYYVAIRAYDMAGQESKMSDVISERPRETFGVSDLAGEKGGYACASSGGYPLGILAFCGGLFGFSRRRSSMLVLMAGMGLISMDAKAEVDSEWPQKGSTLDDFIGRTFEVRYGGMTLSDPNINQVFGDTGHDIVWLKYGVTAFDLIGLTGSAGYYKNTGKRVDIDGNKSAEEDTLKAYPLAVDATFRLDVLPEQFVVPFVGFGYDYWFWSEEWTGGGSLSGSKSGTHTTVGAHILLDVFQPERASRLQVGSGITDTYITVQWRKQLIGDDAGLSFSGDALTIGLKLDH